MKKYLIMFLTFILFIPTVVFAETQATDLLETIESIGLEPSYEEYEETDDQIKIYLFRGSDCSYCHDLIEYLDSITEEYGHMFKLRAFEVGQNSDNRKLQEEVREFLDVEGAGVPLLIVGESTFYGFTEKNKEQIITAIEQEYESDERYDVFDAIEEHKANKNENDALYIIIPILGIIAIAFIFKLAKNEK